MRKTIIALLLISINYIVNATSIEDRVIKLEQTVKAQSDSLAIYKAKVADVEKQKTFLSDIYNGNASWALGTLGFISSILLIVSGYSTVNNYRQVKRIKNKFKDKVESMEGKFKDELLKFKDELLKTKNDLLGNTFENRADIARLFVRDAIRNADYSLVILLYLYAIEYDLKNIELTGSPYSSILMRFYSDTSQIRSNIHNAKQDKKMFNSQLDYLNKKIVEIIELCNKFTVKSDELNLIISEIKEINSLIIRQEE